MERPTDPIAAVTHPDPYPYYADLVARRPMYRDEALGLWVASSADAVTAALTCDLCRVRPPAEPVPRALLGSPAADIFRYLVRMNDGPFHRPVKQAVSAPLASADALRITEQSRRWARALTEEMQPHLRPDRLSDFAFRLPVYVLGTALGLGGDVLPMTAEWIGDFARCLAPGSTPDQVERGKVAAGRLRDVFRALLADRGAARAGTLLHALAREAKRADRNDVETVVANGIGYLSQAYEATAGLIGNTILALAAHPEVRGQVKEDPAGVASVVREVARYDPPVQNTRRFLAQDGVLAGHSLNEGDAVLVILAAANRDPSANPHPERFDVARDPRRMFTFGAGPHACPGEAIAAAIGAAGVEHLLASGVEPELLAGRVSYRVSANTRIPLFAAGAR